MFETETKLGVFIVNNKKKIGNTTLSSTEWPTVTKSIIHCTEQPVILAIYCQHYFQAQDVLF